MDTLFSKYKKIQAIGTEVEVPWDIWTVLPGHKINLCIVGPDVHLCDGDLASIEKARKAIEWYAKQLGGTITWTS